VSRVTYQAILHPEPEGRERFARLDDGAIATRRRDASKALSVRLSREQARWLRDIEERGGGGVDAGAVLRALVDLAAELDIDWTRLSGGAELRAEVRRAVLVRRRGELPPES
jgi:hypothetical protein